MIPHFRLMQSGWHFLYTLAVKKIGHPFRYLQTPWMDCLAYHRSKATAGVHLNVSNCSLRALKSSKSTQLPSSMQIQPSKPPFIHLTSYLRSADDSGSHCDPFPAEAMYSPFAISRALRIESGSLLGSSREKIFYFPTLSSLEKSASEVFHVMVGVQSIFVSSGYILLLFVWPGKWCGTSCNHSWLFRILFLHIV